MEVPMNEFDKELFEATKRLDGVIERFCLDSWTQFVPSAETTTGKGWLTLHMPLDEYQTIPEFIFNCPKQIWKTGLVNAWENVDCMNKVVREDEYRDCNGDVVTFLGMHFCLDLNVQTANELCDLLQEHHPDPLDDVCKCCREEESQENCQL